MKNKVRAIIIIQRVDAIAKCSREAGYDLRPVFARLLSKMLIQIEKLFHSLSGAMIVIS